MKRAHLKLIIPAAVTLISLWPAVANAQSFSEDFDVDHSANWAVNASSGQHSANLFFDYSAVGIPSAPHSVGGTTRGVKLQANTSGGVFGSLSVSPIGQSFAGTTLFDLTCG